MAKGRQPGVGAGMAQWRCEKMAILFENVKKQKKK
jgi:hypothetical protein